jgi:hypothetical protein
MTHLRNPEEELDLYDLVDAFRHHRAKMNVRTGASHGAFAMNSGATLQRQSKLSLKPHRRVKRRNSIAFVVKSIDTKSAHTSLNLRSLRTGRQTQLLPTRTDNATTVDSEEETIVEAHHAGFALSGIFSITTGKDYPLRVSILLTPATSTSATIPLALLAQFDLLKAANLSSVDVSPCLLKAGAKSRFTPKGLAGRSKPSS